MKKKYKFTLIPSPPDPRDWKVREVLKKVSLPAELDYREDMMPIRDQGSQGSCVAMAASAMKEWQERQDVGMDEYMSPQFIYNNRSTPTEGMYTRDVAQILVNMGDCTEDLFPYGSSGKPPENAYTEAKKYVEEGYAWCYTIDDLKTALNHNGPVMISFPVYNFGMEFWKKGVGEYLLGYHMVLVVGYSDSKGHFIIRNSWSDDWGDEGYTYFPYEDWGWHSEVLTMIDKESDDFDPEPEPDPEKPKSWLEKYWLTLLIGAGILAVVLGYIL